MMFILKRMLTFSSCFRLMIIRAGLRIRLARRGCLAWRARGCGGARVVHARPGRLDGHGLRLERGGRERGGAAGALDVDQHVHQHAEMRHDAHRVGAVDVHLVAPVDERPVQVRDQQFLCDEREK